MNSAAPIPPVLSENRRRTAVVRLWVATCAAIGLTASVAGTLTACWSLAGGTPSWLYDRLGELDHLTLKITVKGIPLEFFAAVLFAVLVTISTVAGGLAVRVWLRSVGLVISACLLGVAAPLSLQRRFSCWPVDVSAVAALGLLVTCAAVDSRGQSLLSCLSDSVRSFFRGARRRAITATSALAVALSALVVAIPTGSARTKAVDTANFLNWFKSESGHVQVEGLRSAGRVTVIAFNDYQCDACALMIPSAEAIVRRVNGESRLPIELHIRDFPLDAACNRHYWASVHPAACEAALAVRFLETQGEPDSSMDLVGWMRGQPVRLTNQRILDHPLMARQLARFQEQSRDLLQLTKEDIELGIRLGVTATPTFFVDGVKTPNRFLEAAVRFASVEGIN